MRTRLFKAFAVAVLLAITLANGGVQILSAKPTDVRPTSQPFGNCTEQYWRGICGDLWSVCAWLYGC